MLSDKTLHQEVGDNSKAFLAGRDAIDNSTTVNNYGNLEKQELIDYEIISEIFKYLFGVDLPNTEDLKASQKLTHLKDKIALNFSSEGKNDVEEVFTKLWSKKNLVEKYIVQENDDEEKVEGLILKFQEYFRKLKKSKTHEIEVQDIDIFFQLANYCIPENKTKDSRFLPNALAVVLYFFESCDFGKKTKTEKENKQSFF